MSGRGISAGKNKGGKQHGLFSEPQRTQIWLRCMVSCGEEKLTGKKVRLDREVETRLHRKLYIILTILFFRNGKLSQSFKWRFAF